MRGPHVAASTWPSRLPTCFIKRNANAGNTQPDGRPIVCQFQYGSWIINNVPPTVWVKKIPLRFSDNFFQTVGNF